MDMVAGLEHLGRGTASAVDAMYILVEPGRRSMDVAREIASMARALHIPHVWGVGNKIRDAGDVALLTDALGQALPVAGWLPFDERAIESDIRGLPLYDLAPDMVERVRVIARETGLLSV